MNRIKALFKGKRENVLNVYFTAGFPDIDDTISIIKMLEQEGVDLIEIGMPYSDPLADGPTIQQSGQVALKNGMTLSLLFNQISEARKSCSIPIILMGYYNQMMQFGEERFLERARESGVDGLIIPDLPMDIYENEYDALFKKHGICMSFLVTPETSDNRLQQADNLSKDGFLYVVSKSRITGSAGNISEQQQKYFNHLNDLNLTAPRLIGFGIHDRKSYTTACSYSNGAIIGSAFIRTLGEDGDLKDKIQRFIKSIR